MALFMKVVAPKELLMRFLCFGTNIFEFVVKFSMKMMILGIFLNGSNFEILVPRELLMRFWSNGSITFGFLVKFYMKMMILGISFNDSIFEDRGS